MEFGSVKFFKVVIISTVALLILVPTVLSIAFGINSAVLSTKVEALQHQLKDTPQGIEPVVEPPEDIPSESEPTPDSEPSFDYQVAYPHLYAQLPTQSREDGMVTYLTFDDGPSVNTPTVLEILAENNIKATFFVTGPSSERYPEYLKAIADAGHTLAVHTYSHKYQEIYASVEAFLADFDKMYTIIEQTTGVKPTMFRFPGGSINNYNRLIYEEIIAEMTRRGFTYYDWNISSGDVANNATKANIINNTLKKIGTRQQNIILLHDRQDTSNTVAALPTIIAGLTEKGYSFARLENDVRPFTFSYQK